MDEVAMRHVREADVFAVDVDSDAHEHVLRALDDLDIETRTVGALEGLEAEVLDVLVDDRGGFCFLSCNEQNKM